MVQCVQQIEAMQFGFRCVVAWPCSAAANHKTDHSNEPINRTYDVKHVWRRCGLCQIALSTCYIYI